MQASDQLSLSGLVSYATIDHETERLIDYTDANGDVDRFANTETDATQIEVAGTAYDEIVRDATAFGPVAGVTYLETDVDGFREEGALGLDFVFPDQTIESLQINVGGQASYTTTQDFGILQPYGRAFVVYEAMDDARAIDIIYAADDLDVSSFTLLTDSPDRTRFEVGGGLNFHFRTFKLF